MQVLQAIVRTSRKLGPYVLLEILLPGGTLFALLLFAYRNPELVRRYASRARGAVVRTVSEAQAAVADRASQAASLAGIETAVRALG